MKILAVDPGYERVGIAILEKNKSEEVVLYSECFKTKASLPFEKRLLEIGAEIQKIIIEFKPTALAIETLFFNSNQKTAMNVSEARGVIIYEAISNSLYIKEYTPLQIKMAVSGDGHADKKQMIRMIDLLIKKTKDIKYDDEYDAIAAGLTFFASEKYLLK